MDWLSPVQTKLLFYLVLLCFDKCVATKVYTVESDKVCSPIKKRHIHIGKGDASAVIVKETRYFDTPLETDFNCKFKVETPNMISLGPPIFPYFEQEGVFAVIQTLSLRQNKSTGECIDYIKFRPEGGSWSQQFCGRFSSATPAMLEDAGNRAIADNAVVDDRGNLDVLIHVSRQRPERGDQLGFSIAFTSFRDCSDRGDYEGYAPCLPAVSGGGTLRCIWGGLFNDSIANCPYHGCPDEPKDSCPTFPGLSDGAGGRGNVLVVTVSALASLALAFAVFLSAVWACRKLGRLCWAPRRQATPPPSPSLMLRPLDTPPPGEHTPSAPALDKDPPPTYDSLFP